MCHIHIVSRTKLHYNIMSDWSLVTSQRLKKTVLQGRRSPPHLQLQGSVHQALGHPAFQQPVGPRGDEHGRAEAELGLQASKKSDYISSEDRLCDGSVPSFILQMAERPPPLGRRRGEAEGEEGRLVLVSLPKGELEARRLRDVLPRPHRPPSKSA